MESLFNVLKANLPYGLGELIDPFLDGLKKFTIEEDLNTTESIMIKSIDSSYTTEIYKRVSQSIYKFVTKIGSFIKSNDSSESLDEILYEFTSDISSSKDNLVESDYTMIIESATKTINFIRTQANNQSLGDRIFLDNYFESRKRQNSVNKYITGSTVLLNRIYGEKIFKFSVYESFFSTFEKKRYLMIEGNGGVGKTVLSEWILLNSHKKLQNLIIFQTDFEKIDNILTDINDKKFRDYTLIVYINDIFGSNVLGVDPNKAIQKLLKFKEYINFYPNLYFLINSRENLNEMVKDSLRSEDRAILNDYTKALSISDFSNKEKSDFIISYSKNISITYFESYFSSGFNLNYLISNKWIDFIMDKFNPRLIVRVLSNIGNNLTEREEVEKLAKILENPIDYYNDEIELLSKDARICLFNLFYLIPYKMYKRINKDTFVNSISKIKLEKETRVILHELSGWILSADTIQFVDPGIIDYLDNYLKNPSVDSLSLITQIKSNYHYFRQIYNIMKDEDAVYELFQKTFEDEHEFLGNKILYLINHEKEVDRQLILDLINNKDIPCYIFNNNHMDDIDSNYNMQYFSFENLIFKVIKTSKSDDIFYGLFIENLVDWMNVVDFYTDFEIIIESFIWYIKNKLEYDINEFIEDFKDDISNLLEAYTKSVQMEMDEEWYGYISIEDDIGHEFFECLDSKNRKFYKNKFIKKIYPIVDKIIKNELSQRPLSDYFMWEINYKKIFDSILERYQDDGYLNVYENMRLPNNLEEAKAILSEYQETGIEYTIIGNYEIIDE